MIHAQITPDWRDVNLLPGAQRCCSPRLRNQLLEPDIRRTFAPVDGAVGLGAAPLMAWLCEIQKAGIDHLLCAGTGNAGKMPRAAEPQLDADFRAGCEADRPLTGSLRIQQTTVHLCTA